MQYGEENFAKTEIFTPVKKIITFIKMSYYNVG